LIELAASILAADFTQLGAELRAAFAAGISRVHVDVMDGQFVPNLSMGPEVMKAVHSIAQPAGACVAVHLMIREPQRFLKTFAEAGADRLIVHVEDTTQLSRTLQSIRELGAEPSVAINPATPLVLLEEVLHEVASVLVMSVEPGFGGQRFNPASVDKIVRLRRMLDARGLTQVTIAVDGGINADTIAKVAEAGADSAIAGSAIFNSKASVAENVRALRAAVGDTRGASAAESKAAQSKAAQSKAAQ
jgi:ribulose-phosphate 3-epimerase